MSTPVIDFSQYETKPQIDFSKYENAVSAQPKWYSAAGLKSKAYEALSGTANSLPVVGATAGGIVGGTSGAAAGGIGAAPGAVIGAGLGGAAGEAGRKAIRQGMGWEQPNFAQDLKDVATQGAIQGTIEAGTQGLGALAGPLVNAATKQYSRALAPTTQQNKAIAEKIVPDLLDRGVHGSLEDIHELAAAKADDLRPKIDAAIAAIPDAEVRTVLQRFVVPSVPGGTSQEISSAIAQKNALDRVGSMGKTVPSPPIAAPNRIVEQVGAQASAIPESVFASRAGVSPITTTIPGPTSGATRLVWNDLEKLKGDFMVEGKIADPDAVKAISGVQDIVSQFGNDISPSSLRKLRQIFDNPVAKAGAYAGNDLGQRFALQAKEAAANRIRSVLAEASPDLAKLNKEMNLWLNVQDVTGATLERQTGQQGGLLKTLTPLAAASAGGAGFYAHGADAGIGAAAATTLGAMIAYASRQPAWRTLSAVTKNALADALARGNAQQVAGLLTRAGIAVARESTLSNGQPAPMALGPQ